MLSFYFMPRYVMDEFEDEFDVMVTIENNFPTVFHFRAPFVDFHVHMGSGL